MRVSAAAALRSPTVASSQQWQPTRRQALIASTTVATISSSMGGGGVMAASPTASPIPTIQLSPDLEISRIIKGNWQLSGGHKGDRASDRTSGAAAVEDLQAFANAGITTLDTADIYGDSERIIGQYLASSPDARSKATVLTKFCAFGDAMRAAKSLDFVERSIDNSRINLGVPSLDCVQFYWHDYSNKNYVDAALHLAELIGKGKIKTLGVTNFDVPRLAEIVNAGVPILVNQIQYSLLDPRPENGMVQYCLDKGISILPYGTVAGGFLSDAYFGKKPGDVNINTYSLSKYSSVINQRGGWEWLQSLLTVLHEIGNQYNVGIGEVSSRWVLQQPAVGAVIVGARNATHVEQHKKLFSFELSEEDLNKIEAVVAAGKRPTSDVYSWERGGRW